MRLLFTTAVLVILAACAAGGVVTQSSYFSMSSAGGPTKCYCVDNGVPVCCTNKENEVTLAPNACNCTCGGGQVKFVSTSNCHDKSIFEIFDNFPDFPWKTRRRLRNAGRMY